MTAKTHYNPLLSKCLEPGNLWSHMTDFAGVVKVPGIEVTQPRASLKGTRGNIASPCKNQVLTVHIYNRGAEIYR